ncbi:Serine/threonine-protein kinase 36 [Entophlyctis luteolus]|nr:Serine/threonine-protein kinase 36 [Entophlyctis luteolus]
MSEAIVKQSSPDIASYSIGKCIGAGQYGRVYSAVHRSTKLQVALKLISLVGRTKEDIKALRDEIKCHRKLIHPNIVRCLDSFTLRGNEEVAVITELCPQGDLMVALQAAGKFGVDQNILILENGLKIADFGFAQVLDAKLVLTSVKGTPVYMAPELIQEQPYSHLVDIWALGVMLYELNVGSPPFYDTNIFKLIELIVNEPLSFPDGMDAELKEYLMGLLEKGCEKRLNWPDVGQHGFIARKISRSEGQAKTRRMRPTTTDSGVDMGSAQRKHEPGWQEISGLEVGVAHPSIEAKQPRLEIDWIGEFANTESQEYLNLVVSDSSRCAGLFTAICSLQTTFSNLNFSACELNLCKSIMTMQRVVSACQIMRPALDVSFQLRSLLVWLSSLLHGLLQVEASSDDVNQLLSCSNVLCLTLRLLSDVMFYFEAQKADGGKQSSILRLIFQMYIPLYSRLVYASTVVRSDFGFLSTSEVKEFQTDKWMLPVLEAIKATKQTFKLIFSLPKFERDEFFDLISELGILYSTIDFTRIFWSQSTSQSRISVSISDCLDCLLSRIKCDEDAVFDKDANGRNLSNARHSQQKMFNAAIEAMAANDYYGVSLLQDICSDIPSAARLLVFCIRERPKALDVISKRSLKATIKKFCRLDQSDENFEIYAHYLSLPKIFAQEYNFLQHLQLKIVKNVVSPIATPNAIALQFLFLANSVSREKLGFLDELFLRVFNTSKQLARQQQMIDWIPSAGETLIDVAVILCAAGYQLFADAVVERVFAGTDAFSADMIAAMTNEALFELPSFDAHAETLVRNICTRWPASTEHSWTNVRRGLPHPAAIKLMAHAWEAQIPVTKTVLFSETALAAQIVVANASREWWASLAELASDEAILTADFCKAALGSKSTLENLPGTSDYAVALDMVENSTGRKLFENSQSQSQSHQQHAPRPHSRHVPADDRALSSEQLQHEQHQQPQFSKLSALAAASLSQATLTDEPASMVAEPLSDASVGAVAARPVSIPLAKDNDHHAHALRRNTLPMLIQTHSLPAHGPPTAPPERRFSLASVASAIGATPSAPIPSLVGSPRATSPYSPSILAAAVSNTGGGASFSSYPSLRRQSVLDSDDKPAAAPPASSAPAGNTARANSFPVASDHHAKKFPVDFVAWASMD